MEQTPTPERTVKFVSTEFKAVQDQPRTFKFKISDATVDYDKDIIDVAGWDLTNFRKTGGPVMFGHDYRSLPIAKDVGAQVEGDALYGYPQFPAPGIHPFADTVYALIHGGFLNGASVGFKPRKSVFNNDRGGLDISEAVLLEYSIVPIGANPSALVQRATAAGLDLKPIERWCEQYLDETYGEKGVWVPRFQVEEVFKFMNAARPHVVQLTLNGGKGVHGTASGMMATEMAGTSSTSRMTDGQKPLPTPQGGESEREFVSRCMGDPAMQEEYPDESQRAAVCHSQWGRDAARLELADGAVLELADEQLLDVEPTQLAAAIQRAVSTALVGAITSTVRERIDYARGRVA